MRVPDIASRTHLSRPAVSHHLKILKETGLVNLYRIGTRNDYYVEAESSCWKGLQQLTSQVEEVIEQAKQQGYPPLKEEE
ncbi:Bacterial regulatory protein, arsR family [Clostridiales bacterium CHKCI006]|nr:Bacterial regulatory protein, arsR family [Clostridiales bacterium CHKCI006]